MTAAASEPLLEVDRLTTAFPIEGAWAPAVNGVSFAMAAGETMALVGESGCGKSLTALSIMRLVEPPGQIRSGAIRFRGRNLLELGEREMQRVRGAEIALILQEPMTALNPVFTIGSQIAEPLKVHGIASGRAARARAIELLDAVRVPEPQRRVDDYPHQLSGGLRQRALIAAALACRPALLIADEPTTALDVTIQAQILDLLRDLKRQFELSLLLITHDLGIVAQTRRSRRRDVRRPHRRKRAGASALRGPEASVYAGAARIIAGTHAGRAAAGDRRHGAAARPHPERLRVRATLSRAVRAVRRGAGARADVPRAVAAELTAAVAATRNGAHSVRCYLHHSVTEPASPAACPCHSLRSATSARSSRAATGCSGRPRRWRRSTTSASQSNRVKPSASSANPAAERRRQAAACCG